MKVQEIMTRSVKSCSPETNLAVAAMMMWDGDCGVIPVVTTEQEGQKVAGMITDRDICIAVATKHRRADEITAGEVLQESGGGLYSCKPENDVHEALKIMREHKIRRLPVVNKEGRLVGLISLNDIVLSERELIGAKGRGAVGLTAEEIVDTFKSICGHRLPAVAA
jgi:CBS domain-containing protein